MNVIAVLAQKGGAGKTTVCISLAVCAARSGLSSAIIDLDPQATAANWSDRRESPVPAVVSAQATRLDRVLDAAAGEGADLVLVDTAPRAEQSALAAVRAADLAVLPCRPAIYDLETIGTTAELARIADGTPTVAVLNGVPARGPKEAQARDVLGSLGVDACPASLGSRVAFADAAAQGMSAQEYEPAGKAAAEIQAVYDFVLERVNSSTR